MRRWRKASGAPSICSTERRIGGTKLRMVTRSSPMIRSSSPTPACMISTTRRVAPFSRATRASPSPAEDSEPRAMMRSSGLTWLVLLSSAMVGMKPARLQARPFGRPVLPEV